MPAAVVLLVVASAAVHAAWNAMLKRRRDPQTAVFGVMAFSALTALLGALVSGSALPPARSSGWACVAGVLEAGYFVTLAAALARAPLGPVYTVVRGGALLLVWPVSIALLGERFSPAAALGTGCVVVGLGLTGAAQRDERTAGGASLLARYGWAALSAACVAGYHLAYKVALGEGGTPRSVVAISLGTAALLGLAAGLRAPDRRALLVRSLRDEGAMIAVAGVLATVSFLVFLEAMARAGAGAVLTLRNTSILFAQALAALLGERPRQLGVAGAALVTLGAVLLAS